MNADARPGGTGTGEAGWTATHSVTPAGDIREQRRADLAAAVRASGLRLATLADRLDNGQADPGLGATVVAGVVADLVDALARLGGAP